MPAGVEIERKFLLDRLPSIPAGAACLQIQQGYLSPGTFAHDHDDTKAELHDISFAYGRLRQTVMPDGAVACTHTIKRGTGVQRMEHERSISQEEFERHWPRTEGRRLRKTRWLVPDGGLTWEIDDIEHGWITLAEVELDHPDQPVNPPQWLAPHIVREVTDDPAYSNSALAERAHTVW